MKEFEWFEWFGPSPIEPFNSAPRRSPAAPRRRRKVPSLRRPCRGSTSSRASRPRRCTAARRGRCLSRPRSEVNIELNFPPKLRGARSRLYRRRFLQVNTRWKALAEIYTMHSFAPFWNPLAKNGEKRAWPKQPRKGRKLENERPISSAQQAT